MELFGYYVQAEYLVLGFSGAIVLLFILISVQFLKISDLKKRLSGFMEGQDARSMEEEIRKRFAEIKAIREAQERADQNIEAIFEKLAPTYRKGAIKKYNAFREMGGQLSFVMVLLDQGDNGFLLNSVHSTTAGSYMYVKKIERGEADIPLSAEEEETLKEAMERG